MTWLALVAIFAELHKHSAQTNFPKLIALTFDDGPHPIYTPQVLGILRRYKIKATFFLIGERVGRYPEVARQIVAEGHEVGNHTYSHPNGLPKKSLEAIKQEIEICSATIEQVTGIRPQLFRPPRGFLNYRMLTIAQLEGYTTVFWTVSADQKNAPTPEAMAERVLRLAHPGAIILMHDGRINSRWKDVKALPLIIKGLKKQGYKFVTVSELLKLSRH